MIRNALERHVLTGALRRGLSLATQKTPAPTTPRKRVAGDVTAIGLAGIGVLHAAWGAGVTWWPGEDAKSLAEKVVGGSTFPSAAACYSVAGLLGIGSGLIFCRCRVTDPKWFALSHLATYTVSAVLLLRGAGGFVVSALELVDETTAFRRANLAIYSPLCMALGVAAGWSARPSAINTKVRFDLPVT